MLLKSGHPETGTGDTLEQTLTCTYQPACVAMSSHCVCPWTTRGELHGPLYFFPSFWNSRSSDPRSYLALGLRIEVGAEPLRRLWAKPMKGHFTS